MSDVVCYAVSRGIATITLDSPANRNSLSRQLVAQLGARLDKAAADAAVRAVVLTHAGPVFCAGADLKERGDESGTSDAGERLTGLLGSILTLPKPVIARVDGAVRAGGLGVIGACDLVIAGSRATFAFTEVRLGLAPAIISLTTLNRMNARAASRYLLTGEVFGSAEAVTAGLATVAAQDVDAALEPILGAVRQASPQGLAETKQLTTAAARSALDLGAQAMRELSARLFDSAEAQEGVRAFLEKRVPRWSEP